jgi:hypothetical protein
MHRHASCPGLASKQLGLTCPVTFCMLNTYLWGWGGGVVGNAGRKHRQGRQGNGVGVASTEGRVEEKGKANIPHTRILHIHACRMWEHGTQSTLNTG